MGRFISKDREGRISEILFREFKDTAKDRFLRAELERYVPLFAKATEKEIISFADYTRELWTRKRMPELGKAIASLNPTFVDSIDNIVVAPHDYKVYTRGSVKENGYRMQLHIGPQEPVLLPDASAFTRQFTRYDLRMFPELHSIFFRLPVMIGDAELINRKFKHLAGFNRVQERIPNMHYWPRKGELGIDDSFLEAYLNSSLFKEGYPKEDFELSLAFHGLFAIADPSTWYTQREVQLKNLISLCNLPVNYRRVDELLDRLAEFIEANQLNARVAERRIITNKNQLRSFVAENEKMDLEGTVVAQYATLNGKPSFKFAKSYKIKKYETIDTVLLGVYLDKKSEGLEEENMKGLLLGLYDEEFRCYVPVCRVNVNPYGVQIKTEGQRDRLVRLRAQLVDSLKDKYTGGSIVTLYDVYIMEAKIKLQIMLQGKIDPDRIVDFMAEMPRNQDFLSLLGTYEKDIDKYNKVSKRRKSSKKDNWINTYKDILGAILDLRHENRNRYRHIRNYFREFNKIRNTSRKLVKPQIIIDTSEPIILETRVFDIKYSLNPFAAGFHSYGLNSFKFNNCYAEFIRYDKITTTDYATIHRLAKMNTVKKR